jgi:hypothetical protein
LEESLLASTYTAEVLASSRYEAAALGVAEFKRWGFMDTLPGPGDAA